MKITKALLGVVASIVLVACGGGGAGNSNPSDPSTLSGVAAVGDPIASGTIQIKCAGGDPLDTTTDTNGAWHVTISGQTPPCAIEVSGGTVNGLTNTVPYHSIATSVGTVNVTPLTDLMLANLQGTATPDLWFASLVASSLAPITQDLVETALAKQCAALSGLTQLCASNAITTEFTPTTGNSIYNLLVALQKAMGNSGVSYATLLGDASDPTYSAPVGTFNTALTAAYTATTTNFTGDFLAWTGSADAAHSFRLVRVDGQTGAITNIGGSGFFTGLAYGPDGQLYGISNTLQIINSVDGSTTKIGDLVYQGGSPILMSGATFSPNGILYVLENGGSPQRIFTVDTSNGTLTYVGAPSASIRSLVFASDGTLYGSYADLFIVSASDASTIATVGSLGGAGVYVDRLTFGSGGTLFGAYYTSSSLYSVNLGTGLATSITALSGSDLNALVAERTAVAKVLALSLSSPASVSAPSSPQDMDGLLQMEKEIKSAQERLLP